MKWFVKCIQNYVTFTGRARRSEYWYFILFAIIFMFAAALIDVIIGTKIISSLFGLFIFLPQIAVMVRRLHDTDHSGKIVLWYYLAGFVWMILLLIMGASSFIGLMSGSGAGASVGFIIIAAVGGLAGLVFAIMMLVWFCTPGTVGDNKYGSDPKLIEE